MIRRHSALWNEWGRLDEDDPRIPALTRKCVELEFLVVSTPAWTSQGLTGTKRLMKKVAFHFYDIEHLTNSILKSDEERIAAAR